MSLRCVYTDLDGTLLGAGASLFTDEEGNFSMAQARALEAASRAGVEVVIMSGRRRAQVHEDARIIGQNSFIFDAGAAFSIDQETTLLLGDFELEEGQTPVQRMSERGVPRFAARKLCRTLEYHDPLAPRPGDVTSLPRGYRHGRGQRTARENGHGDLRLLDNGAIHRRMEGIEQAHCYHLVPKAVSKVNAVAAHAVPGLLPGGNNRRRRFARGP